MRGLSPTAASSSGFTGSPAVGTRGYLGRGDNVESETYGEIRKGQDGHLHSYPHPPWASRGAESSPPSSINMWSQATPCRGGCAVHCRLFNSNPGLSLQDASCTSPIVTIKTVSRYCQRPQGTKWSLVGNHWFKETSKTRETMKRPQPRPDHLPHVSI